MYSYYNWIKALKRKFWSCNLLMISCTIKITILNLRSCTRLNCSIWCIFDMLVVFSSWHFFSCFKIHKTFNHAGYQFNGCILRTGFFEQVIRKKKCHAGFFPVIVSANDVCSCIHHRFFFITAWHDITTSLHNNLKSTVQQTKY